MAINSNPTTSSLPKAPAASLVEATGPVQSPPEPGPSPPEPELTIPQAVVDKCFIEYTPDRAPQLNGVPIGTLDTAEGDHIALTPALLSKAVAAISASLAAHTTTASTGTPKHQTLPVTVLCSPHPNTLVPLDAAIRYIAHSVEADIVILNPADLANGRWGVFGEELTEAFWQLYNYHYTDWEASDARYMRAKALVRAFLLMRSDSTGNEGSRSTRRRIIFLRDYGALSKGLSPLLPSLYEVAVLSNTPTLVVAGISPVDRITATPRNKQKFLDKLRGDDFKGFLSARYTAQWRKPRSIARWESLEGLFLALFGNRYHTKTSLASRGTNESLLRDPHPSKLEFTDIVSFGLLRDLPRAVANGEHDEVKRRFLFANLWHLERAGISFTFNIAFGRQSYLDSNSKTFAQLESTILYKNEHDAEAIKAMLTSPALDLPTLLNIMCKIEEPSSEWKRLIEPAIPNPLAATTPVDPILVRVRGMNLSAEEKELLGGVIDPATISTTFANVQINPEVIDTLRMGVMYPALHPELFNKGILAEESMGGVLLFGPPGTGKTMVCRALAKECGARMLQLTASSLQRKWLGETEKLITAAFNLARRLGPCVLFVDELDALFSKRNDGSRTWERTMVTEFCQQMDGLKTAASNKQAGLIVIGASNRPQDIDTAIMRRLSRRILVDLPTLQQREAIISQYLANEEYDKTTVDVGRLAVETPGFSGSDLRYLVHSAALAALKDTMPNEQVMPGRTQESALATLQPRVIQKQHFDQAFQQVSASNTNQNDIDELNRWAKNGRRCFAAPPQSCRSAAGQRQSNFTATIEEDEDLYN